MSFQTPDMDYVMELEVSNNMTSTMSPNATGVFVRYTWTAFLATFYPMALTVDRYITPVWYVLGICGNIISAHLWMTRKMRRSNSSAVYLAVLAVSDTCFLLLHIVQELSYAWDVKTIDYPVVCETYFVLYLWAQYLSPLLVFGFTTERWIAVCKPFLKERYCTESRAVRITAAICVGALSLCVIQSYFWTYYAPTDKCRQRIEIRNDLTIVWTAWTWTTELLVFGAVPIVILIFNLFVIAEIRRLNAARLSLVPTALDSFTVSASPAMRARADSEGEGGKDGRGGEGKGWVKGPRRKSSHMGMNKSTTLMLLYVSFYVIVTTLPATLVYAIYHYFPEGDHSLTDDEIRADGTWRFYLVYIAVRKIVEEVCISHYACNFILYVTTGPQFRKAAAQLFDIRRFCPKSGDLKYVNIKRRSTTCATSL